MSLPGRRGGPLSCEDLKQIPRQGLQADVQTSDQILERRVIEHFPSRQLDQASQRLLTPDHQPIIGPHEASPIDAEVQVREDLMGEVNPQKGQRIDGLAAQPGIPDRPESLFHRSPPPAPCLANRADGDGTVSPPAHFPDHLCWGRS
jgi:hypothetical protein